ncbi:MAG: serine/threonine-protein kinase [Pirellulales bacterium]
MSSIDSISCPTSQQHQALLDDRLDENQRQQILQHLQICSHCQSVCESLVASLDHVDQSTVIEPIEPASQIGRVVDLVKQRMAFSEADANDRGKLDPNDLLTLGAEFQLIKRLGQGAQGVVYQARDLLLQRDVVIKLLAPRSDRSVESIERFRREARSLASLQSPFVVPIFRVGELPSGKMFMVMAYVEGTTLRELQKTEPLSIKQSASFARQIAQGLSAVHDQHLVHRDIKPENVLIDASNRQVRIADFGLAFDSDDEARITVDGALAGTPAYMSPEQVVSPQAVDHRCDIYSLGVVLYELLTSQVPFRGTARMTLLQLVHDDPVPPRTYNEQIPKDLETICLKAFSKDAARRFQSAAEFSEELNRFLTNQPIHSRPMGRAEKFIRRVKRNPLVSALVACVVLLVGIATSLSVAYAIHYRRLNNLAEQNSRVAKQQRDSALSTLVDLVFQLQRKFDSDEIYIDEIQHSSLEIAMRGLEKVEGMAGGTNEGSLAMAVALRRLGQTLFNLDRTEESSRCLEKSESLLKQLIQRQPKNQEVVMALADTVVAYDECKDEEDDSVQLGRFAFACELCREIVRGNSHEFQEKFAELLTCQARCQMQNELYTEALKSLGEAENVYAELNSVEASELSDSQRESKLFGSLRAQTYRANTLRLKGDSDQARDSATATMEKMSRLTSEQQVGPDGMEFQLSLLELLGGLSKKPDEQSQRWLDAFAALKKRMLALAESDGQEFAIEVETVRLLMHDRINEALVGSAMEFAELLIELSEARLSRLPNDYHALVESFDARVAVADLELTKSSRRSRLRAMEHCFKAFECMERISQSAQLTSGDWSTLVECVDMMLEGFDATRGNDSQRATALLWLRKIQQWTEDEKLNRQADKEELGDLRDLCEQALRSSKREGL